MRPLPAAHPHQQEKRTRKYYIYVMFQFARNIIKNDVKKNWSFPPSSFSVEGRGWHPRRPRGGQSGREKRCDKSFQAQVEKPLGTDSHRTISKRSSERWLLIGHKKCFVLLCPIGEQHLLSSFREFVHDGYWLDHGLSGSCTKEMHAVRNLSVWYKRYISKYW